MVTVTCENDVGGRRRAVLAWHGRRKYYEPTDDPEHDSFLNGALLTVATASGTQFTAAFNFYKLVNGSSGSAHVHESADTGTVQVTRTPVIVTYNDQIGLLQTWNTTNYMFHDKIGLL